MYNRLSVYAKEFGIKIALENMWTLDKNQKVIPNVCSFAKDLAHYYDNLDPESFTVCLDLGHGPLVSEEPKDAIKTIGAERMTALHVHDVDYIHDLHTLPYLGKIDWDQTAKALAEINYRGDFTFEIPNFFRCFPAELLPSAARLAHDTGRLLMQKIEKYKIE